MGERGAPPTPTAILHARGSKRAKYRNIHEPRPAPSLPKMPSWLDDIGRKEWRRMVPMLHKLGVLTKLDKSALASMCQSWSEYIHAIQAIREMGELVEAAEGRPHLNPMVKVRDSAFDKWRRMAREFGLTPASRPRIQANEPEGDKDGVDRFFIR